MSSDSKLWQKLKNYVFGNTIIIAPNEVIVDISHKGRGNHTDAKLIMETFLFKPLKKYVECGPLRLDFENRNEIFAEIYLNFHGNITGKIKDAKRFTITFEEKYIILNYNGKDNIFEYNEEEINLKLESFMEKINNQIQFKIIKIQTSKLDNNTSLINDTIYDEQTRKQLREVENFSLWNYVKEELFQSYLTTVPNTKINHFILNSTMYKINIKFTLEKAIEIMCNRTFKYAILLMVYAYEAQRINYCTTPYWDQLMNKLNKLSDALINLNGNRKLLYGWYDINRGINESDTMRAFQRLVNDYANIFVTPQKMKKYNSKEIYTCENIEDQVILSQHLLDKILKGFPKHHPNDESYQFELIPPDLCEIEEKLQQIFKLIDAEFENIYKIDL